MLLFSPDVKIIQAFFFQFPRLFCDPNPDSWSLNRRNEIVCIFIHSFFDPDPHFFAASINSLKLVPINCSIKSGAFWLKLVFILFLIYGTCLLALNFFIKVDFVSAFPKLVSIWNNIVPKIQEHVSFWLKLVPVGKNIVPE